MPPVFEQVTSFYELLLRFGDQADNRGKLTGAHLQTITQSILDGKVIATTDNGPKQLSLIEGEDGDKLFDILGKVNTETLVRNEELSEALIDLKNKGQELANELAQSLDREKFLTEQLSAAQVEVQRLQYIVSAAQARSPIEQGES